MCGYDANFSVLLKQRTHRLVLQRGDQILVSEEPSLDQYIPAEIRLKFITELTCVDELIEDAEDIHLLVGSDMLPLVASEKEPLKAPRKYSE